MDCVVVKDLSRFGREYIDAGKYIERLFPALGVRFIAVNDHYDSLEGKSQADEIVIPFKNLINDAYFRDISIKIRSHLSEILSYSFFLRMIPVNPYFSDILQFLQIHIIKIDSPSGFYQC